MLSWSRNFEQHDMGEGIVHSFKCNSVHMASAQLMSNRVEMVLAGPKSASGLYLVLISLFVIFEFDSLRYYNGARFRDFELVFIIHMTFLYSASMKIHALHCNCTALMTQIVGQPPCNIFYFR